MRLACRVAAGIPDARRDTTKEHARIVMSCMNRRQFLAGTAAAVGAGFGRNVFAAATQPSAATRPAVSDTIVLGKTGIKTSRLAIGTGTKGGSEQKRIGQEGLNRVLRYGLDNGIRWWDTADMYAKGEMQPMLGKTLTEIKRDQVVITSKTWCRDKSDPDYVRKDLDKFRKQLNTDYIDIVLMHCMEDPKWPEKMKPHMDALSEAKARGLIRAHGVSCHTLGALQAAADEPWVEIDLARFNPFAVIMDVDKREKVNQVEQTLEKMHARGKAVYVMKLIGEGRLKGDQISESLRFSLSKPYITGLNNGFSRPQQLDHIARRVESIRT
jgi:aryl-alcohol dehydrogenase-like predicted oxidoreductase